MNIKRDFSVLRDFSRIAAGLRLGYVLIGAGARLLLPQWRCAGRDMRHTEDWDFGVQLENWKAFEELRKALQGAGLFRATAIRHRMLHVTGAQLDFVPFGNIESPTGTLRWEGEERSMNVLGFAEALSSAHCIAVEDDFFLPVVGMPGFSVLKLFSYADRVGHKKIIDLQDCYTTLSIYHAVCNPEAVFDRCATQLISGNFTWEMAGAWMLGIDAAEIMHEKTRDALLQVLEHVCDEEYHALEPLVRLTGGSLMPEDEEVRHRRKIYEMFRVFRESIREHAVKKLPE